MSRTFVKPTTLAFILPLPVAYDLAAFTNRRHAMHVLSAKDVGRGGPLIWGGVVETAEDEVRIIPEVRAEFLGKAHFGPGREDSLQERGSNSWLVDLAYDRLLSRENQYSEDDMKQFASSSGWSSSLMKHFDRDKLVTKDTALRFMFRVHPLMRQEVGGQKLAKLAHKLMEPVDKHFPHPRFTECILDVIKMARGTLTKGNPVFEKQGNKHNASLGDAVSLLAFRNMPDVQITKADGSVVVASAGRSLVLREPTDPPLWLPKHE